MITPEQATRLAKLHANAAFRSAGPSYYEDELTGRVRVMQVPVLKDGKPVEEEFCDRNGKPVYKPDGKTRETRVKTKPDTGCVYCDIVDRTANPPGANGHCLRFTSYATATGNTEGEALDAALSLAENSVKPLTPAQRADIEAGRIVDPVAKARITELERELAALRIDGSTKTQNKRPNTV